MVSVILNWIYIIITTFVVGYGVLRFLTRHLPYPAKNAVASDRMSWQPDAYVMCGLVCVTVYAQFFSLFSGVGLWANLILCVVCIGIFMREREGIFETLTRYLSWKFCAVIALFFLFAYGTSRGTPHYDTALYHAQSIRWIEAYGAVKGLGNLHCRLAYNSASFVLSALYSMAFLGRGSFHCVAGFLAFVLAAGNMRLADSLRERKLRASDFARVMCVYYLVNIFDEMISPASDYFMVLIAFYIVITWLSLAERGEKEIFPYALLCVLSVFLLTVKLSAALILLLTIYPACRLVKEKRWRESGVYLGLGFLTALPFFIRNVILSGWLVYPFTSIDLFDVIWKIPKGVADYDAREIQVWGRGYSDVTRFDMPMREWLSGWFRMLAGSDKLFVLMAVLAVAVLLLQAVYVLWRWSRRQTTAGSSATCESTLSPALLTAQATVAASFLFWLCTSPLIRYGCVYVYLTPAVVFGGIYAAICRRRAFGSIVCAAVCLLLVYKAFALGRGIISSHENAYWLLQKDYENFAVDACEIEGVIFYYPAQGDQTGYDAFPSAPAKPQIAFLGTELADGFRAE
ncbi:MAG: hypothetical protein K2M22_00445 [Lachnospiraceae bacterium]|nr:hypothetical protein [Lachnospiraceae bacterium]MDE7177739.1 hypothetical protein [Lachnospiraceae bacterium]